MKVETVINKHGQKVYNVTYDGCIQEFNTLKGAEDFVKHLIEVGALPTPTNAGEVK